MSGEMGAALGGQKDPVDTTQRAETTPLAACRLPEGRSTPGALPSSTESSNGPREYERNSALRVSRLLNRPDLSCMDRLVKSTEDFFRGRRGDRCCLGCGVAPGRMCDTGFESLPRIELNVMRGENILCPRRRGQPCNRKVDTRSQSRPSRICHFILLFPILPS